MAQINSNQNQPQKNQQGLGGAANKNVQAMNTGKLSDESIDSSRSSIESSNVDKSSREFSGNTQQSAGRSSVEGEEWNEETGMDEGLESESDESLSASQTEQEENFEDSEYEDKSDESFDLPRKEQSINKDRRSSDKLQ